MNTINSFRIREIPADVVQRVRDTGVDVSGNPVRRVIADGGEPLRCCLRDARAGEPMLLFGYEPPLPGVGSPYREIGAVYTHAERCAGPDRDAPYPTEWYGRAQVVRAYDSRGWITRATVHDGTQPERAIASLLADPAAVIVQSRNVAYGCYMFTAVRHGT